MKIKMNILLFFLQVEVRVGKGDAVNIHMHSVQKPGLLAATMQTIDNMGLDVQQAAISCLNGFTLDIFRAEVRMKLL